MDSAGHQVCVCVTVTPLPHYHYLVTIILNQCQKYFYDPNSATYW